MLGSYGNDVIKSVVLIVKWMAEEIVAKRPYILAVQQKGNLYIFVIYKNKIK